MIKVLMVCHGNICRSPMAEFLLKDMVAKRGIASQFDIASAATSREEIGNPVHHGTRKKLAQFGISVAGKTARQMTRRVKVEDPGDTDLIEGVSMDVAEFQEENERIQARIDAGEITLRKATYIPVLK